MRIIIYCPSAVLEDVRVAPFEVGSVAELCL